MKKTLIVLAVAASAAVSGSAMAWETNGTGGSVNIGGSLTPVENITPWEVKTGAAVTGLDADITKGQSVVNISVGQAIPVLGIRTVVDSTKTFKGGTGISPQINFHGAIDLDGFESSVTTLTLNINNDSGDKIGSMVAPLVSGAEASYSASNKNDAGKKFLIAARAGQAFFGAVPKVAEQIGDAWTKLNGIDKEFLAHYNDQNLAKLAPGTENFIYTGYNYSAYYGAGIQSGKVIKLTLDSPAQGDTPITWKASLPITVSYQ